MNDKLNAHPTPAIPGNTNPKDGSTPTDPDCCTVPPGGGGDPGPGGGGLKG
jgi:hypothetical protein